MDPPVENLDKIENQKEGGPSLHCGLYDTQVAHKIAQIFLPGLATACVDNTTGDIFRSPGSVAADIRKEMIDYLTRRSESFVAEHIVLQSGSEIEASHDPYDIVSDLVDDFAASKRNLFSRVSGWLLSERREDNIDDFAQEMELSGFWLTEQREGIAHTLLKNVDFKNLSHCKMKFQTEGELLEHALRCGYRTMNCENEGCTAVFCSNQMENHDSVCPFKVIPCEQKCSERIMRREMDRHCITMCTMKLVNCPFRTVGCLSDVHQCEIQQHHFDNVSSHLMYILRNIYKEASPDDLKPRAEQIQQLSTGLSEARNIRSLTNLVKEIDAKLGPLEIKPKISTDSDFDKPENTEKKALEEDEVKEKAETAREASRNEVVSRESGVFVDNTTVEEAVKKVSEAEIAENVNEEGELKAQRILVIGEFTKEGDNNNNNSASDLSDRTETKAPEVVVMDEDSVETEHSRPKIEVNDIIDEEIRETKKSTETKTEAPSRIVMDKEEEDEDSVEREHSRPNIEVKDIFDKENIETKKSSETETEAPSRIVMNKEEEEDVEGTETVNSMTLASDEKAEALSKSSEEFSKAQTETVPNMS
ncbi:unnamed protein product [Cochlearia groenlandica]